MSGLKRKYHVERLDGRDKPGGDKANARYFVLDYVNDPKARAALLRYAQASNADEPALAADILRELLATGGDIIPDISGGVAASFIEGWKQI